MTTTVSGGNPFQRASTNEREYLAQLAEAMQVDSFYPQPNRAPYDCMFISKEITCAVESKIRRGRWDDYDTTLIEMGKYKSLIQILKANLAKMVMYVEFFPQSNLALCYNLMKVPEPEWTRETFVKNTVMDHGKVVKAVGYIDKSLATKVELGDIR